jgi:hypothetical protein
VNREEDTMNKANEKNKGVLIQDVVETETPCRKRRATRRMTPIVESQVRRSERNKKNTNGF